MVLRVDIRSSRELQDLVRGLKSAPKAVQASVRANTRKHALQMWQKETRGRASTMFETRFAETARVKVSEQNVTITAGGVQGKRFRNGFDMRKSWSSVEYGSNPAKKTKYNRKSKNGGTHTVTRRTMTMFRPRVKGGTVASPAASDNGARLLSLWVQTAMKIFYDETGAK